jgi:hypothetical protein
MQKVSRRLLKMFPGFRMIKQTPQKDEKETAAIQALSSESRGFTQNRLYNEGSKSWKAEAQRVLIAFDG